jgi:hypothetical protein
MSRGIAQLWKVYIYTRAMAPDVRLLALQPATVWEIGKDVIKTLYNMVYMFRETPDFGFLIGNCREGAGCVPWRRRQCWLVDVIPTPDS